MSRVKQQNLACFSLQDLMIKKNYKLFLEAIFDK